MVGLAVAGPAPATGLQAPPVVIPDEPACACVLVVERALTLADPDGRAGLAIPLRVERAPNGHVLVVPAERQGELLEFGADGAFVRRIGRPGRGPGDFGAILALAAGPADSMYVMDAGNRRLVVLDGDLEIARFGRLPVVGGWFGVLDDGSVVILTAVPRGSDASRDRLTVLDRTLQTVRTFLPGPIPTFPAEIRAAQRRIGVAPDGRIVVSHVDRYELEVWRADGSGGRVLLRSPPWFQTGGTEVDRASRSAGPPAAILAEAPRIDAAGRLWTVVRIAASPAPAATGDDVDSVVEVIDPDSGELIASARVDADLRLIAPGGWAAAYREDEEGRAYVDVYAMEVVEVEGSRVP